MYRVKEIRFLRKGTINYALINNAYLLPLMDV